MNAYYVGAWQKNTVVVNAVAWKLDVQGNPGQKTRGSPELKKSEDAQTSRKRSCQRSTVDSTSKETTKKKHKAEESSNTSGGLGHGFFDNIYEKVLNSATYDQLQDLIENEMTVAGIP